MHTWYIIWNWQTGNCFKRHFWRDTQSVPTAATHEPSIISAKWKFPHFFLHHFRRGGVRDLKSTKDSIQKIVLSSNLAQFPRFHAFCRSLPLFICLSVYQQLQLNYSFCCERKHHSSNSALNSLRAFSNSVWRNGGGKD